MQFGPRELVFAADSVDKSATLPRVSPDGRFLMFTLAKYGVFHIWHHDADLWMMDLQTGEVRNMEELNSPDTESYHSWSSNGKWVVFSSRRYDGNYTRPFIAHIDSKGHAAKPFELPCANPDRHRQMLKSYNVPEFMRGPVTIKPQQFAAALKQDPLPAKYTKALTR
jgi:dipeptidyl aminopeptidase/acylaminoacyl peptidase